MAAGNFELQQTLDNPTPTSSDYFARAVATSGDYVIVGAERDDVSGSDAGTAYIYARTGTSWALQATLSNPSPAEADYFGYAVAISGDYAVVGAYNDDTGASNAGSAYIYARTGTSWALQATLSNPAPTTADFFGYAVAISGDYAVVGAYADNAGAVDAGRAYIYARTGTSWALQATLSNPDPTDSDFFGYAVAISGDYAIVGAHNEDTGAADAGTAYTYYRTGTVWALLDTLRNPAPESYDRFATAVAVSGNYAIVGAWSDNAGGADSGSAYVYYAAPTGPVDVEVNGVSASTSVGDVIGSASSTTRSTGVRASVASGYPLVWSPVDDAQTPGWTPVK